MKRAAIYARVSTLHQSETSIDTQIDTCKKFCESKSIHVSDIFSDKDSGAKTDRMNFSKMIENALNGKYDLIVVDKFDRFYRNDVEDRIITRRLEEQGVLVLSASEGIDVSSPAGKLMRWILSDINSFYRDNLIDEVKRKTILVAKKGYWLGGKPPYGYRLKPIIDNEGLHRTVLDIEPKEAEVVRLIFAKFIEGLTYRDIASYLNKHDYRTRKGNQWTSSSLYSIVHNAVYDGTSVYNYGTKKTKHRKPREDAIFVPNSHPAIISHEMLETAQKRFRIHPTTEKYHHLLTGIIFCGDCGSRMIGNSRKYLCYAWKTGKADKYVSIGVRKVENAVLSYIRNIIFADVDFEALADKINQAETQKDTERTQKLAELYQKRNELRTQINNIVAKVAEGKLVEFYEQKATELETAYKQIEKEIYQVETGKKIIVTAEQLKARRDKLIQALESPETVEQTIKALIKRVIVYPGGYIKIEEFE